MGLFLGVCNIATAQNKEVRGVEADLTTLKFSVEEAPEWSALLKRSSGWFGGDGIYTIPLDGMEQRAADPDKQVLFIFSDSMIGEIKDGQLQAGVKMIHNSVAILKGTEPVNDRMTFYWDKDDKGSPESVFVPKTPKTQSKDYYWLGDGFVNQEANNDIYIFGYRIRNVASGTWGFREVGNTLIKLSAQGKAPFTILKQMDTPFFITDSIGGNGSFGAGIYVNTKKAGAPAPDGYIYVYGVKGKAKQLLAARVLPVDFENYSKWTFWDGSSWNRQMNKSAALADQVSNELSVTALPDGRYALIFQIGAMSKDIGLRIGRTPYGPFGPVIKIWNCAAALQERAFMVYNAKAHPGLSKPGELLISYNVNSVEFLKDLGKYPNLYRPRFIRLKFTDN